MQSWDLNQAVWLQSLCSQLWQNIANPSPSRLYGMVVLAGIFHEFDDQDGELREGETGAWENMRMPVVSSAFWKLEFYLVFETQTLPSHYPSPCM